MSKPVQLYCWHFMAYPHLPADFDEKYDTGWVTVPNRLWDAEKSRGLYQQYIDQLVYADELGFDGMVLNEHHQNIYGLMPSPNLIAAALSQTNQARQDRHPRQSLAAAPQPAARGGGIRHARQHVGRPPDRRLRAGLGPGDLQLRRAVGASREQFWEAVDLIHRAWTEPGPFAHEGRHYPLRYVNPWPQPTQKPHPPIWIPSSRSTETLVKIAKRGYSYFLSSRSHGSETAKSQAQFAKILEERGEHFDPFRMGILMSAYVAETDAQAKAEAKEGVWYFLKNCLKGHLRREGRQLTFGPGIPYIPPAEFRNYLKFSDPTTPLLGDADDWDDLERSQSIIVGSPETVYRRILDIIEHAKSGHLLIQFHLGNMAGRAGAQEHAAVRRARSRRGCARIRQNCSRASSPPWSARRRWRSERNACWTCAAARSRCSKAAGAIRWSICTASPTCTAWRPTCSRSTRRLAETHASSRPAHPGCDGQRRACRDGRIDDVVFHYLELFDALGLEAFDLVGHCVGGWIAAELAVRHPERVRRLVLIGACGLFVPGEPIGDVFMHAQPERGVDYATLRQLLFAGRDAATGLRFFPDGRGDIDEEMRRYQMLRFGSFVGFKPPYFYHPRCAGGCIAPPCRRWSSGASTIAWSRAPTARPMSRDCRARTACASSRARAMLRRSNSRMPLPP